MGTLEDIFGGQFAGPWRGDRFMNVCQVLIAITVRTKCSTHKTLTGVGHAVRLRAASPLLLCWGCAGTVRLSWNGDRPRFVHTKPMCSVFRGLKK